ncbi:MAG: hypothetical protein K0S24_4909 [Sphingobacterium sp.]|nr:hypothetical protein [Sphingobacterium sp.]
MVKKESREKANFETFEGVYCSGFFLKDPSMLTAMSLLFDKVHILNNLEYVIEFSKKYRFNFPKHVASEMEKHHMTITPATDEAGEEDPFEGLTREEKKTATNYLYFASQFLLHNHELVGNVITTSLLPHGEVFNVKLINEGQSGELNTYSVKLNSLSVTTGGLEELNNFLNRGVVPLFARNTHTHFPVPNGGMNTSYLATLIGMKAVEMVLPPFKSVKPEVILEARARLNDQLPLFWAAMLRIAAQMKLHIQQGMSSTELDLECKELVHTILRPILIELKHKMDLERKQWFHKIIAHVGNGIKLFIGNPQMNTAQYISTGLKLGVDVALDINDKLGKGNLTMPEHGLAFLIETDKVIRSQTQN